MSESKFLSPLKALKRPDDIASLYLLCIGLGFALAYSVSPMSFGKAVGIFVLLLAAASGSYLIANYTGDGRDESSWLHWMTSATFMISIVLAAFVDPTWLAFAWLLPLEFLVSWERRCRGRKKSSPVMTATWKGSLVALGLHATYQALTGHWTLWLPAGIFFLVCGVVGVAIVFAMIESTQGVIRQRRETRERERAWRRDKPVIDALLPIFREFTSQLYYDGLLDNHAKHLLTKKSLLALIDGSIRGLKVGLDDTCRLERRSAEQASSLERQLEVAEQAVNHGRASYTKLAKLVFEILARFRSAPAPVDEGTLASWRRDIGFELVASHLLDLHPDTFEAYLADWPVSGASIKALLRHSRIPVTGYPSLPDEWQHVLTAILLANTLTQDAAPSAPAPAPQN